MSKKQTDSKITEKELVFSGDIFEGAHLEQIAPSELVPNPKNPRTNLHLEDIDVSMGVKTPVLVTRELEILKGHRRTTAAIEAGLKTIPVLVLAKDVTPEMELELLADHDGERGLNKAECFNLIAEFIRLGYNKNAVIRTCRDALCASFGKPEDDSEEALLKKFRGTLQHMERLVRLPEVVRIEALKKWNGEEGVLTQKDVKTLDDAFQKLQKADPVNVTAANPPAEFIEKFEAIMEIAKNKEPKEAKKKSRSYDELNKALTLVENELVRQAILFAMNEIDLKTLQEKC